jgi:hypothetical protein
MPHTEAEFFEVIGTKVWIVFLQRSHGTIREITSLYHHTDVPHTEAEFLDVIGTKVVIVFLQRSHGTIREITSLPPYRCAA